MGRRSRVQSARSCSERSRVSPLTAMTSMPRDESSRDAGRVQPARPGKRDRDIHGEHDHREPFPADARPAERRRRAAEEARANARAGEVVFLGAGRPMRLSSCQPLRRDDEQLVGCAVDVWRSWPAVKRLHHAECALALIARASATRRRRRSRAGVHL